MMRFGLVGTGYWARETHATALAAHPDAELAGVWGRSFDRATDLAGSFGAEAYQDVDEMFADSKRWPSRCRQMSRPSSLSVRPPAGAIC